jgi:hypothetical protein
VRKLYPPFLLRYGLIALVLFTPVVWAAMVYMSGRDGIERHTVSICVGMACHQESFMWGTCRFPGNLGALK